MAEHTSAKEALQSANAAFKRTSELNETIRQVGLLQLRTMCVYIKTRLPITSEATTAGHLVMTKDINRLLVSFLPNADDRGSWLSTLDSDIESQLNQNREEKAKGSSSPQSEKTAVTPNAP